MASGYYDHRIGQVHYAKRGWGEPMLLVHNLYPGASSDEFEHNVDALARHFKVYLIDLLGFGLSEAPPMKYTARTYVTLIHDFIKDIIGLPTHTISAGLSCAYLAEVAVWKPELVRSLTLICPRSEPVGLDSPRWIAAIRRAFISNSILGSGFYETMSGKYELTAYLRNCFHNPRLVTEALVDRLYVHAHRPGSITSYASLLTGYLDCPILKAIPHVTSPSLLVWGRQARPTPVEHSVRLNALLRNGHLEVVENAGSWVHVEQPRIANDLIIRFANAEDERREQVGPTSRKTGA